MYAARERMQCCSPTYKSKGQPQPPKPFEKNNSMSRRGQHRSVRWKLNVDLKCQRHTIIPTNTHTHTKSLINARQSWEEDRRTIGRVGGKAKDYRPRWHNMIMRRALLSRLFVCVCIYIYVLVWGWEKQVENKKENASTRTFHPSRVRLCCSKQLIRCLHYGWNAKRF